MSDPAIGKVFPQVKLAPEYARQYMATMAEISHDPDTQTACLIVTPRGEQVGSANRMPYGVRQLSERIEKPAKYLWIMHAERRAIALAARKGVELVGSTM